MTDGDEEPARPTASGGESTTDADEESEPPADGEDVEGRTATNAETEAADRRPGTDEESSDPTGGDVAASDRPDSEQQTEPAADTPTAEAPATSTGDEGESAIPDPTSVPPDVRKYERFKKIDGSTYERANEFLRDRTYITAREWAIARLCADFRTETGVEMTKIGEHLPQLVPFMTDTYSPQAVNQARHAFEEKVRKSGATFLYGAMCDFFTAEELDDVMYEATEVAKFLLEVEGIDLAVEEELAAEESISSVMREVRESSAGLRHDEVHCPECGHSFAAAEHGED